MFLGKAFLGIHWVLEGLILGFSVVGFQVVHTVVSKGGGVVGFAGGLGRGRLRHGARPRGAPKFIAAEEGSRKGCEKGFKVCFRKFKVLVFRV